MWVISTQFSIYCMVQDLTADEIREVIEKVNEQKRLEELCEYMSMYVYVYSCCTFQK